MPRTLRGRLIAASASVLLVTICTFVALTIVLVGHRLRASLDTALRQRAQDVAQLAVSAPALLTEPGALETPVAGRQIAVEVVDAHQRILARSLALGVRLLPEDARFGRALAQGQPGYEDIDLSGRHLRLYAAPIAQAGGPAAGGVVLVAGDTGDIAQTIRRLAVVLALSGAGLAVLGAAVTAALTRRGLRPLAALVGAAEGIERTANPEQRLPEGERPAAEISGLTGVLNRMLASLANSRAVERRFLADASHELRTPVTTLIGNVEFAARHGVDDELLAELRHDAARLARLVDDLLVLEREAEAPRQMDPLSLDRLVQERLAELPRGEERAALLACEPIRVRGEAAALARVLENLVENALVHGPPDGRVNVALRRSGNVARLSVSDSGPGPPPEERALIFERFRRGAAAAGRPGSGLGLSIVAAIVERHGGRVDVDGSEFTVTLPLA